MYVSAAAILTFFINLLPCICLSLGNRPRCITVPTGGAGRLDVFLASNLGSSYTRSRIGRLCEQGCISVNSKPEGKSYEIKTGDVISLSLENEAPIAVAPEPIKIEVLYEDDSFLAVNKPAGMVVHPAVGSPNGTFVNGLLHYLGQHATALIAESSSQDAMGALRPGVVHRLDKGTSGVLLAGKTPTAVEQLSALFAGREVSKYYLAVSVGNPGDATMAKPIGRSRTHRQQMRTYTGAPGKMAITHVRTLASDGKLSVCLLRIETGRTHQIRVHLQDRHTPVLGDEVYGNADWNKRYRRSDHVERPLLHAYQTSFLHPDKGEKITITAPIPKDITQLIDKITASSIRNDAEGENSRSLVDRDSGKLTVECIVDCSGPGNNGAEGYLPLSGVRMEPDEYAWQAAIAMDGVDDWWE